MMAMQVGGFPVYMFYASISEEYSSSLCCTSTGSQASASAMEGYTSWVHDKALTEENKKLMQRTFYGNQPSTIKLAKRKWSADEFARMRNGEFSEDFFLVSPNQSHLTC